jgi:hypothetical protein
MSIAIALSKQFDRGWRMIDTTVAAFSEVAWRTAGRDYLCPARLAYHIAGTVEYYVGDDSDIAWSHRCNADWKELDAAKLPSQVETTEHLHEARQKMHDWIENRDDESILGPLTNHRHCGQTKLEFALYILRHTLHHHGEMNALSVLEGAESDNWR